MFSLLALVPSTSNISFDTTALHSHGTADNFLLDKDGNKTWNIESLVTEVCDVQSLVGKPKLFFIEACRGKENNFSTQILTKSSAPPQQSGITLPRFGISGSLSEIFSV